jgi:hypothetical protein
MLKYKKKKKDPQTQSVFEGVVIELIVAKPIKVYIKPT